MGTLYEIAGSMATIVRRAEELDGELPPELEAELDAIGGSYDAKLEGLCKWRANLLAEAESIKPELDRLREKMNARANKAEWIRAYILRCLLASGDSKREAGTFSLSVCRNSRPKVSCNVPAEELPDDCCKLKREIDSSAILARAQAGQELPRGVRLIDGVHLRIS